MEPAKRSTLRAYTFNIPLINRDDLTKLRLVAAILKVFAKPTLSC